MKSVRRKLSEYSILKAELKVRQKELSEDLYNTLRAASVDDMPKGTRGVTDLTGEAAATAERIKQFKKEQIEHIQTKMCSIENAVNSLEYQERHVLYTKYIQGISWLDLPEYTGYQNTQNHKYEANGVRIIAENHLL